MSYDAFISQSSKDKEAADAICTALEANGVHCWIAPRDLVTGESWAEGIIRGISECRAMVLVFSSAANASPHVRREVERAVFRDIPLAPVRIEDVMPVGDMEYFLAGSHWMDALTRPIDGHLPVLVAHVHKLLGMGIPVRVPRPGGAPGAPVAYHDRNGAAVAQTVPRSVSAEDSQPEAGEAPPAFGRYEAVRRVPTKNASTSAWVARAEGSDEQYFLKLYRPPPAVQTDEQIAAGARSFLARARAQQLAAGTSQGGLAPILDLGPVPGGACSVSRYYPWSARGLLAGKVVAGGGKTGAPILYRIARGALNALTDLRQSCKRGHGNITPAHVLLDGAPGDTRFGVSLTDPVAPDKLGVNGAGEEANDLFSLGQILYELVTGRPWKAAAWPITRSPAWQALGRTGDGWRELCNRLLNPNPSDGINGLDDARAQLASLAPRSPRIPRLPGFVALVAGVAGLVTLCTVLGTRRGFFTRQAETESRSPRPFADPGTTPVNRTPATDRPTAPPVSPASAGATTAATVGPAVAQARLRIWSDAIGKPAVRVPALLDAWEAARRNWVAGLTAPDAAVEKDLAELGRRLEALERDVSGRAVPDGVSAVSAAKLGQEREKVYTMVASAVASDAYRRDPTGRTWRDWASGYAERIKEAAVIVRHPQQPPASAPSPSAPPETPDAAAQRRHEEQLAKLKNLFISERITAEQYDLGKRLLTGSASASAAFDAERRSQIVAVVEGRLAPNRLGSALSAIETAAQRAPRAARTGAAPPPAPASAPAPEPDFVAPPISAAAALHHKEEYLAKLKELLVSKQITDGMYELGEQLLKGSPSELEDYDAERRGQFVAVIEGRMEPGRILPALVLIGPPKRRIHRADTGSGGEKKAVQEHPQEVNEERVVLLDCSSAMSATVPGGERTYYQAAVESASDEIRFALEVGTPVRVIPFRDRALERPGNLVFTPGKVPLNEQIKTIKFVFDQYAPRPGDRSGAGIWDTLVEVMPKVIAPGRRTTVSIYTANQDNRSSITPAQAEARLQERYKEARPVVRVMNPAAGLPPHAGIKVTGTPPVLDAAACNAAKGATLNVQVRALLSSSAGPGNILTLDQVRAVPLDGAPAIAITPPSTAPRPSVDGTNVPLTVTGKFPPEPKRYEYDLLFSARFRARPSDKTNPDEIIPAGPPLRLVIASVREKVGYAKCVRLLDSVKAARQEEDGAKQQFASALEEFRSIVNSRGGNLEAMYNKFNDQYQSCESRASKVNSNIDAVKHVATAVFDDWKGEIGRMGSEPSLQQKSQELFDRTHRDYDKMIARMDAVAAKMPPVQQELKDRALFIKSNLNLQAFTSLKGTEVELGSDVDSLIREMNASIVEADNFIAQVQAK